MCALYDIGRHEPLAGGPWDPGAAGAALDRIVRASVDVVGEGGLWPAHPRDSEFRGGPQKTMYNGASGIVAALALLEQKGAIDSGVDLAELARRSDDAWQREPDAGHVPSLFLGEAGVLLVRAALAPSADVLLRLERAIHENSTHAALELLWGSPGTMLAALHLYRWTADERWRARYLESAAHLFDTWQRDAESGTFLWRQQLWGDTHRLLGACHGATGAIYSLLAGAALLSEDARELVVKRSIELARATAMTRDGLTNWAPEIGDGPRLLQWCHGAPGIVSALCAIPKDIDASFDALLEQAGELIFHAGPLRKGAGLCHGTAGNGYALLALYQRTADERWLERARSFAMHAIVQHEQLLERWRRPWFSLWTGDLGLALYLADCLAGSGGLPFVERLDLSAR
jgi:hypothetical protein